MDPVVSFASAVQFLPSTPQKPQICELRSPKAPEFHTKATGRSRATTQEQRESSKLEGHKSLTSIKGIGKITVAILLSEIGDVNDFPDESRLASYFGIVPREELQPDGTRRPHSQTRNQTGADGLGAVGADRGQLQPLSERFSGWRRAHERPQLGDPPPGIKASGSRSAARRSALNSRTEPGSKGSLRRGSQRRAVASCAPFCRATIRDGLLRREPDADQFLRLTKDENQCGAEKTSSEAFHAAQAFFHR